METVEIEQVNGRGCDIDVHKKMVVSTIDGGGEGVRPVNLERLRVF